MKKFIKKTIAGLIAGVMAISSMPFVALTAQAADSKEKDYVKANIESFTGYTGTASAPTTNWYGNPEVANALYVSQEYSDTSNYVSKTYRNSDGQKYKFMGYKDVVLLNTTTPAYFPVTFEEQGLTNYSGTAKREYDYIATTTNGFQTKDNWVECSDWHTYTAKDSGITASGDINYNNTTTGSSMGYPVMKKSTSRDFRNKVYLNQGDGNVSQFYDKYDSISFDIRLDYYYDYTEWFTNYKDTLTDQLLQNVKYEENKTVYVVNYKPIAEKISAMKDVYAEIKANGEKNYAEADLDAFYQAAYKVMSLNPNTYSYSSGVANAVKDAGDAIKDVVNNYLTTATTKLTKLDSSAYDAALKEAEAKVLNPNNRYTTDSIDALRTEIASVKTARDSVKTNEELEALTTRLLTAISNLVQVKFNVVFVTVGLDSTTENEKFNDYIEYGETYNADALANVKKWVVTTDNGNTSTVIDNFDQKASFVITKDAKIYAYLSGEDSSKTSSKVTFLGRHNQVVAIRYVADGKTLETKDVDAPDIPFYHFENWDVASVKGDGNEYTVKASYTCNQASSDFCTVHFGDWSKPYAYDSYVYLPNTVAGTKYALYSDEQCTKLLTVLDGVDFYAPKTSDIYVKAYDTEATASIAVTGSFAEKDVEAGKNYANFNCKFYLPDGANAIEWGVEVLSPDGTRTANVKGEKLSERNEYTVRFGTSSSSVTSIKGRAYLEYVKDGVKTTIYSSDEYVTVNLNA